MCGGTCSQNGQITQEKAQGGVDGIYFIDAGGAIVNIYITILSVNFGIDG